MRKRSCVYIHIYAMKNKNNSTRQTVLLITKTWTRIQIITIKNQTKWVHETRQVHCQY